LARWGHGLATGERRPAKSSCLCFFRSYTLSDKTLEEFKLPLLPVSYVRATKRGVGEGKSSSVSPLFWRRPRAFGDAREWGRHLPVNLAEPKKILPLFGQVQHFA
jgi:hypothetical protein